MAASPAAAPTPSALPKQGETAVLAGEPAKHDARAEAAANDVEAAQIAAE